RTGFILRWRGTTARDPDEDTGRWVFLASDKNRDWAMSERILNGLLCALIWAMGLLLVCLLFAIQSEGDKFRPAMGMCIGAAGALLICFALIITSLIRKTPEERLSARQLPHRSQVLRDLNNHTVQEDVLLDPVDDAPLQEVDRSRETVESDAGLF